MNIKQKVVKLTSPPMPIIQKVAYAICVAFSRTSHERQLRCIIHYVGTTSLSLKD